jgi:hypothetical protein
MMRITFIFALIAVFTSCKKDVAIHLCPDAEEGIQHYVFLGHIYESNNTIDSRIEAMSLSCFHQVWLGGDVCIETTEDQSTLNYLDNLFQLGSSKTHWTLGNHDVRNGNLDWITNTTNRNSFYVAHYNGMTLLVLNSSLNHSAILDCQAIDDQYDLIENVCDTIQESSHLVLLTHHVVWDGISPEINTDEFANGNSSAFLFRCSTGETFGSAVYPLLQQVQSRGVKVLNIAGDLGQKETAVEFTTDHGIVFLGSGITAEIPYNEQFPSFGEPDKVLVLHHNILQRQITWEFKAL